MSELLLSSLKDADHATTLSLLVQSHISLSSEISKLSAVVSSSASRRDVDRALAIFSSLVIASLGLFISIR